MCPPKVKQPKIEATPAPTQTIVQNSSPPATTVQALPQSPDQGRAMEIARRGGTSSLRINRINRKRPTPKGPSVNIPRT